VSEPAWPDGGSFNANNLDDQTVGRRADAKDGTRDDAAR